MSKVVKQQNCAVPPAAKSDIQLPQIYEAYLIDHQQRRQLAIQRINVIRRVLIAFNQYLEKHKVVLASVKIEQIDTFLAEFFAPFAPKTRRVGPIAACCAAFYHTYTANIVSCAGILHHW